MLPTSLTRRARSLARAALPAFVAAGVLATGSVLLSRLPAAAQEAAVVIPAPAVDEASKAESETALVAGGCFWGVQGVFQHVKGVRNAVSGYAGGAADTATYEQVSTGTTGHAETVAVTFDPSVITYGQVLQVFFSVAHNPTSLNYQGPDHGTQYRSAIFPTSPEQKRVAEAYIAQLEATKVYDGKIVTATTPAPAFYPAEGYHQDFLTLNPRYPYIAINDMPKIDSLKAVFPALYRNDPVLVASAAKS